jgi:hypothetical protein
LGKVRRRELLFFLSFFTMCSSLVREYEAQRKDSASVLLIKLIH